MDSKEYGQRKRPSGSSKRFGEKRSSDKGYTGRSTDSGAKRYGADGEAKRYSTEGGAKRYGAEGGPKRYGADGGPKRYGTEGGARRNSTEGGPKRYGTEGGPKRYGADGEAKRYRTDGGFKRYGSDRSGADGEGGGRRFAGKSDGKPFSGGAGGKRFATGTSGKRFETRRGDRTSDAGPGVKRDERPERRRSEKAPYKTRESGYAGERGRKEFDKAPAFKARRKDAFAGEEHTSRPTEGFNEFEERDDRIEGRNPVLEALRSERPLNKVFIEKDNPDATLAKIAAMAREKSIPVQYVDRKKLDAISTTRIHQGVILEAAAHEYVEVDDILKVAAEKNEEPFVVILDGITDINNFGSIIRSAECAGAHGIIIPKRRSATLNATVAKVAAGAQEYVAIARVANLTQAIRDLKDKGVWITAADVGGDRPYYDSDLKGPLALVIGSEGEGISKVVKDECDYLVKIPMKGKISSLNAGVAAGLIMFEISRRRG